MNRIRRTATAAVAALALSLPTAAITTTVASAAPENASTASQSDPVAKRPAKKAKPKLVLKKSALYSHVGQPGVKFTAIVKKGKKKAAGKVSFSVNGAATASVKLRKGQASYRLPSTATPGVYQIVAKYKNVKKKSGARVYNSAISLSATTFTISAATDSWDLPVMTGTVQFKDAPATKGYVDIYQNGNIKGGSGSPDYCCMAGIEAGGAFDFSGYSFLAKVQEKGPGTYTYQAFYTDGPAFADYIYSTPITVTVTP